LKKIRLIALVAFSVMVILVPIAALAASLNWHTAQLIEYNTGRDGYYAQVAMSGTNAVAVWQQSDENNYRIYSNYSTDSGRTWSNTVTLLDHTGKLCCGSLDAE
jgi:hypothetical protein